MKKKCFKCLKVKDLKQFYAHPRMADGHLNKCKSCAKSDVQKHRSENLERIQDYDRNRPNQDERREVNRRLREIRISTPEGRRQEWARIADWAARNRHKRKAQWTVGNAVKRGLVANGASCERCGATELLHAHHEDYTKPLEINWLCRVCHGKRHKEINHERRLLNGE